MYDYKRRAIVATETAQKTLRSASAEFTFTPYEAALANIRVGFVDAIGRTFFDYVNTLHARIGRREPWASVSGFQSWDFGFARESGGNAYSIRVYQKSAYTYPSDVDPNVLITVDFVPGLGVDAKAGRESLLKRKFGLTATPSDVGMQVGAAWEKLLTGSVDYGD